MNIKNLVLGFAFFASQLSNASSPYVGIGVQMSLATDGTVFITDVFKESPAEKAGVVINEALYSVDGIAIIKGSKALEQASQLIRQNNTVGTIVTLGVGLNNLITRSISVVRDYINPPCLISGWVNLTLSGDANYGWLTGWLDNQHVDWSISGGRARAWIGNQLYWLDVRSTFQTDFEVTGWIGNDYIRWRSMGNRISEHVSCIGR